MQNVPSGRPPKAGPFLLNFFKPAGIHPVDLIGKVSDFPFVGDDKHRRTFFGIGAQKPKHQTGVFAVEISGGFVGDDYRGNTSEMTVPFPGSLVSEMSALWNWAACFTIESPKPVPATSFEWLLFTR